MTDPNDPDLTEQEWPHPPDVLPPPPHTPGGVTAPIGPDYITVEPDGTRGVGYGFDDPEPPFQVRRGDDPWPDPSPEEQTGEAARLGGTDSDDPVVFVEQSRRRIERGELDPQQVRQHALNLIADGVDLPRELVADVAAGAHWADPDGYEQLLVRERAAHARHRARTRQLQDIQNTALAILIPLIGFISAILLAGIARLVWLVP